MKDRLRNRSVTFSVLETTKDENRVEDQCQAETVKARLVNVLISLFITEQ